MNMTDEGSHVPYFWFSWQSIKLEIGNTVQYVYTEVKAEGCMSVVLGSLTATSILPVVLQETVQATESLFCYVLLVFLVYRGQKCSKQHIFVYTTQSSCSLVHPHCPSTRSGW